MKYSHLQGINIGSGQHYAEGWFNTDIIPTDKGKQPDLLIDIHDFLDTFEKHSFKKAYVGHVLEHVAWGDELTCVIQSIAYVAETVMVVGPCLDKAMRTSQPKWLIDGIVAPDEIDQHPWSHKWTPLESNTFYAIQQAGFIPEIVDIGSVNQPEWPNPTVAPWQTAMKFTS
jgi:predicted SAM-dependent methyltransferase